jgi:hypothetical protein
LFIVRVPPLVAIAPPEAPRELFPDKVLLLTSRVLAEA